MQEVFLAGPVNCIVYVDNDHIVVAHARALLEKGSPGVLVLQGDVRDPGKIIDDAKGLIDFSEPVAVLLFAILHFLTDADDPHAIVASLAGHLAPGSAVAISHLTGEGTEPDKGLAAQEVYQGASAPAVPRSRENITRLFDGLDLIDPGVPGRVPGRRAVSPDPVRRPGPVLRAGRLGPGHRAARRARGAGRPTRGWRTCRRPR